MDEISGINLGAYLNMEQTPTSQGALDLLDKLRQDPENQDLIITVYTPDSSRIDEKLIMCILSSQPEDKFESVLDAIKLRATECGAIFVSVTNVFDPRTIEVPTIKKVLPYLANAIENRPRNPGVMKPHPYGAQLEARFKK